MYEGEKDRIRSSQAEEMISIFPACYLKEDEPDCSEADIGEKESAVLHVLPGGHREKRPVPEILFSITI